MSNRYVTRFRERKVSAPPGPAAGREGTPGAEASGKKLSMKTVAWPSAGPARGAGFNKTTKMRIVKTAAHRIGLDA